MMKGQLQRGLIGMLVCDRDRYILKYVFEALENSLANVPFCNIDLIVIASIIDQKAIDICRAFKPSLINELIVIEDMNFPLVRWKVNHTKQILEMLAERSNTILQEARKREYEWVFTLDSDILLNPTTLQEIISLNPSYKSVAVPYKLRWSRHPLVGIFDNRGEFALLINPHLVKTSEKVLPCAITPMGVSLIRKEAYHVPFSIRRVWDFIGYDVGFCLNLLDNSIQPYCLSNHLVEHICPHNIKELIPFIDNRKPIVFSKKNYKLLKSLVKLHNKISNGR